MNVRMLKANISSPQDRQTGMHVGRQAYR